VEVRETATLSERAAADVKSTGKMPVQFISPGWGSSGYYSPEVLQEAVANRVLPAGTHMYADHPTKRDRTERPERSIRDLMAVTTSDAQLAEDGSLRGEIRVMAPYQALIQDLAPHIGVSIFGDATDVYEGEAEGRRGRIIEGLDKIHSVDFVTRAGRGGQILSVLESATVDVPALTALAEKDFSPKKRKKLARSGAAMPDGSFPIENTTDLANAVQAVGRASNPDKVKKHIKKRARALGATSLLPAGWVTESASVSVIPDSWLEDGIHVELAEALQEVVTSAAGARGEEKLHAYWSHGEGAAKIRWGVDGDFNRCVDHLSKYITDPQGYCAKMHKEVTGARPGHAAGESAAPDERVITLLESGLGVDQDGHSYRLEEGDWHPVVPRERVLTVLESGLALDEEGHTYRYDGGWAPLARVNK